MNKHSGRLFGIFFILSFISYAIGSGLMEIPIRNTLQPVDILENKVNRVIGGILIAIVHTIFNIGLIGIMYNVLRHVHKSLSIVYLALSSFSTLLLALGAVFLFLPVSVSESLLLSKQHDASILNVVLSLSSSGNFYCYQLGMMLWGVGGLCFCYLLYKSNLVPVVFALCGCLGYLIFITGCVLELVDLPYGILLSMPGGIFEIILSIWFIAKGFSKRYRFAN